MEQEKWEALRKQAAEIEKAVSKPQKVCSKPCDQCLFSKNKIVNDERKAEILEGCEKDETHFICHKGTIAGQNVVCNGFFRNKTTPYLELMKAAGRIELVDPHNLQQVDERKKTESKSKKTGKGKRM